MPAYPFLVTDCTFSVTNVKYLTAGSFRDGHLKPNHAVVHLIAMDRLPFKEEATNLKESRKHVRPQ